MERIRRMILLLVTAAIMAAMSVAGAGAIFADQPNPGGVHHHDGGPKFHPQDQQCAKNLGGNHPHCPGPNR